MVFLSIELAAIATQRRDSIKQKIDISLNIFARVVRARDAAHIGKVYEGFCRQRMPAAASL
jgi:hypothetical protein